MENREIARILRETAQLLEIVKTGDYSLRKKLLKKYPHTILDLLTIHSLGPKKVGLLWRTFKAATVEQVENLAREGKLRDLPGFGEKSEENILKAVEVFRQSAGRFLLDFVESQAAKLTEYITAFGKLVQSVT